MSDLQPRPAAKRPTYTAAERALLQQLYPKGSREELLAAFPTRNMANLSNMANRLGIARELPTNYTRAWSVEHLAILREHYPEKGAAYVAELTGRNHRTVLSYAGSNGIRRNQASLRHAISRPARPDDWTPKKDAKVRALYPAAPQAAVLAALQPHTWCGIACRARKLNVTRARAIGAVWSEAEKQVLRQHFATLPFEQLLPLLPGRTEKSIRGAAHYLKLKRAKTARPTIQRAPQPRPPKPQAAVKPKPLPAVGLNSQSPATPVANAQKALRIAAEKAATAKPKGHVSADMIRALPAAHPARLAFTRAAYHGPAAAAAAYHAAMQQAA